MQMRVKIRQVIFDNRGRVALGIDSDEQSTGAIGIGPERMQHLRDLKQRGRADIGAMGKAEEHQEGTSLHILIGERLSILVFKLKRPANGGDGRTHRRQYAPGDEEDGAKKQKQPAEKS